MTTIYKTDNSTYEVDVDNGVYRRGYLPSREQHVDSHRLMYGEWLPLRSATMSESGRLHILHATSSVGIYTTKVTSIDGVPV